MLIPLPSLIFYCHFPLPLHTHPQAIANKNYWWFLKPSKFFHTHIAYTTSSDRTAIPHCGAPSGVLIQGTAQGPLFGKTLLDSSNHPSSPAWSAYYRLSTSSFTSAYPLAVWRYRHHKCVNPFWKETSLPESLSSLGTQWVLNKCLGTSRFTHGKRKTLEGVPFMSKILHAVYK